MNLDKSSIFYYSVFSFILLAFYKLLGLLRIVIFPTIDRVTRPVEINGSFTTMPLIDDIILLCLSSIILFTLIDKKKIVFATIGAGFVIYLISTIGFEFLNYLPLYVAAIFSVSSIAMVVSKKVHVELRPKKFGITFLKGLLIFEILALIRWLFYPIVQTKIFVTPDWQISLIESEFYYFFALGSTGLIVLLIFSFLLKASLPAIKGILLNVNFKRFSPFLNTLNSNLNLSKGDNLQDKKILTSFKNAKLFLFCILLIGTIMPVIPYIPSLNPASSIISVDVPHYQRWISVVEESGISSLLSQGTTPGDRPLSLLTIYSIHTLFNLDPRTLLQFFPILLTPLFCLGVYLLVREGTRNEKVALVSSAFSLVSYIVLVGIYAGLLANWIAVIVSCFSFFFLLRFMKTSSKIDFILVSILSIAIFQFHTYSGYFYMTVLGAFLIMSLFTKGINSKKKMAFLALVIILAFSINYYKSLLIDVPISVEEINWATAKVTSIENFAERWQTLSFVMHVREGGIFPNSLMISLAIFWAITVNFRDHFERLLFAHIPILTILFLFGDPVLQSRQLYVLPVMLFASLGAFRLMKMLKISEKGQFLFLSFLFAFNSNYLLRILMNLDLVLPETGS